jgi:hypothetical protein
VIGAAELSVCPPGGSYRIEHRADSAACPSAVTPGQQDRGMDNATPFDTRVHTSDDPEYSPLEAIARLSRATDELPAIDECDFMYMGCVVEPSTTLRIHLYKHIETRHYLNLDDGGHTYQYCGQLDEDDMKSGGMYRLLPTLAEALHLVVDDLVRMRPSRGDARSRRFDL